MIANEVHSKGAVTITLVNDFRVIGQGPGNDFIVSHVLHMTTNANGELTASVDQFTTRCQ